MGSMDPSAALEISCIDKGVLMPRMTTAQRDAIAAPAEGLLVYDTDVQDLYVRKGSAWAKAGGEAVTRKLTSLSDIKTPAAGTSFPGELVQLELAGDECDGDVYVNQAKADADAPVYVKVGMKRMTTADRTAATATGCLATMYEIVYDTDEGKLYINTAATGDVPVWLDMAGATVAMLEDADSNTTIEVEQNANEDKIRLTTNGIERLRVDEFGVQSEEAIDLTNPVDAPASAAETTHFWKNAKDGYFRAVTLTTAGGTLTAAGDELDAVEIGKASFAAGINTKAKGMGSVALGVNASATADYAIAMGWEGVAADGPRSLALGGNATTGLREGAVVIGDHTAGGLILNATTNNEFSTRFSGGYRLFSDGDLTAGVTLAAGAGAWASVSDVNKKENFKDLNKQEVLAKIAELPVTEWNYIAQEDEVRHIGPMAQDFHEAFQLSGTDNRTITTSDIDGVNMVAIQALYERVLALEKQNAELRVTLVKKDKKIAELKTDFTAELNTIKFLLKAKGIEASTARK